MGLCSVGSSLLPWASLKILLLDPCTRSSAHTGKPELGTVYLGQDSVPNEVAMLQSKSVIMEESLLAVMQLMLWRERYITETSLLTKNVQMSEITI